MDKTPQAGASGLYQPLRTPTSIRVLELEPGKGRSALRAKLETVNLKDDPKPTYEALSYTWGSSSKGRKIYIASEKLSITNNLYDALRRLRRKDKVKTIWVDAICIDQTNNRERSHQVAIMGNIYRQARYVNAWFGEPGRFWSAYSTLRLSIVADTGEAALPHPWLRGHVLSDAVLRTVPAWSTRVWVVQEAAYAEELYLCFGRFRWMYPYGGFPGHYPPRIKQLTECLYSYHGRRAGVHTLSGMLDTLSTTDLSASDPRDFVYSMLSFVKRDEARAIGSDYTLAVEEVYAKATFAALKHEGHCEILDYVQSEGHFIQYKTGKCEGIPSTASRAWASRPQW